MRDQLTQLRQRLALSGVLFQTEMRAYLRNRVSVFWVFGFPVLLFVILGFAVGSDLGIVRVALNVERDPAAALLSRHVEQALRAASAYDVQFVSERGDAHLAIAISGGNPPAIELDYAPGDSSATYLALRTVEYAALQYAVASSPGAQRPAVRSQLRTGASEQLRFDRFLFSGILVLMLLSGGILSLAYVLTSQREQNVLKALSLLPLPPWLYLLSVMSARLVVMVVAAATFLLIGTTVFGMPLHLDAERALALAAMAGAGGALFLSVGFLIASRTNSSGAAELIGSAVYYPLLLLGNLTIPLREQSSGIEALMHWLPTSQLADGMRLAMYSEVPFQWPLGLFAFLLLLTVVFVALGARTFRFTSVAA